VAERGRDDDVLASRLERLEDVVAFQDRLIADLNHIVVDFTRRVEALERAESRRATQPDANEPEVGPHHDPPPSLTSE
jgi:uncharacterized coiled-coil protein SlyX